MATKQKRKALFVYISESQTGLSGKAKKIEEGFAAAGFDLRTIYFKNQTSRLARLVDWLSLQGRYLVLIIGRRNDVIFIRYAYYFIFIYLMSLVLHRKIQIEINSNVEKELIGRGQRLRVLIDSLSMWVAVKSASRIHVASEELAEHYRSRFHRANIVFTQNFVVDEHFSAKPDQKLDRRINLLFLGNTAQKWHGIDRFIQKIVVNNDWFMKNCSLHIIGYCSPQIENMISRYQLEGSVTFHGFLSGEKKYDVIDQMDVGIGNFLLSIKGMREATAIKMREYLYSGLVIIQGCIDSYIPEDLPFVLRVDLEQDLETSEKIFNFIEYFKSHPEIRSDAHEYAREHLLVSNYIRSITE